MGPPATHESGHFYFAQTGHSHFAATGSGKLVETRELKMYDMRALGQIGGSDLARGREVQYTVLSRVFA
jgi:hypothetical protein